MKALNGYFQTGLVCISHKGQVFRVSREIYEDTSFGEILITTIKLPNGRLKRKSGCENARLIKSHAITKANNFCLIGLDSKAFRRLVNACFGNTYDV